MLKTIITFLAALCLATSALAVDTTFVKGPARNELLFRSQFSIIETEEYCVNVYAAQHDANVTACDDDDLNEVIWPQTAQVRNLRVITKLAGDADTTCEYTIEVAGTSVFAVTSAVDVTAGTVSDYPLGITLTQGDLVGIMVGQGVTCGSGTANPEIVVELWGSFID